MGSMGSISGGIPNILMFLLPGFVWAGVYSSLISRPISDGFQVVVRAFIFTVVFQVFATPVLELSGLRPHAGDRNAEVFATPVLELSGLSEQNSSSSWIWEPLVLVLAAVAIGIASAHVWNKDYIHKILRRCNVTVESSYPSALYPAFAFHRNCYVVMHLKGEGDRRLYGKPKEWPSRPDDRYFLIEDCEWLAGENRKPVERVSHILIPESEVEMVEFLPANFDTDLGKEP